MPETDMELLAEARAYRAKAKRMRELALLAGHPEVSPILKQYALELEERAAELCAMAEASTTKSGP